MIRHIQRVVTNIALAALAVVVIVSVVGTARETIALKRQERSLRRELATLVEEKQRLETELVKLNLAGTVERRAKERLNLKYPGEEVVLIAPEPSPEEISTTTLPWLRRMWRRIFP